MSYGCLGFQFIELQYWMCLSIDCDINNYLMQLGFPSGRINYTNLFINCDIHKIGLTRCISNSQCTFKHNITLHKSRKTLLLPSIQIKEYIEYSNTRIPVSHHGSIQLEIISWIYVSLETLSIVTGSKMAVKWQ